MTVSQVALGVMLISCLLGGFMLAPMHDILLIPRTLLCGTWLPWVNQLRRRLALPDALQPWQRLERHKTEHPHTRRQESKWRLVFPGVLTAVADFLFVTMAAVVLLLILYDANDGVFRISAAVAMLMGILLGRMTLARWMALMAQTLYTVLRAGLIFALALVTYPITALSVFLWVRSAPRRQLLRDKRLLKKQKRQQKREAKRNAVTTLPSETELAAAIRPKPDGRRVFCTGRAR